MLQRLSLPFGIDADALRLLSALPALTDLSTPAAVLLDGALPPPGGPMAASILSRPPAALAAVTRLSAGCIRAGVGVGGVNGSPPAPRFELGQVFPALCSLSVRRGGDRELQLAAGLGPRLESLMLHSAPRAGDGALALLGGCRGLVRLQIEGAPWIGDEGVSRLFSVPAPCLTHLALHGLPRLTDNALIAATAACRRLAAASFACCPGLTDKTLSRLARVERLTHVTLYGLGPGVTAEGICTLAAAPGMVAVRVAGCCGVRPGKCAGHRPGVRVVVDDADM